MECSCAPRKAWRDWTIHSGFLRSWRSNGNYLIQQTEIRSANSTQLIQVYLRVPFLGGLQRLFPCDFPSRIRRRARHHARKSGFSSLVRLVVKPSADNTVHKRLLLLSVRKFQV